MRNLSTAICCVVFFRMHTDQSNASERTGHELASRERAAIHIVDLPITGTYLCWDAAVGDVTSAGSLSQYSRWHSALERIHVRPVLRLICLWKPSQAIYGLACTLLLRSGEWLGDPSTEGGWRSTKDRMLRNDVNAATAVAGNEQSSHSFFAPAPAGANDPFVEIRAAAEADDEAARALLLVLSALRETIGECRPTAAGGDRDSSDGKSEEPSPTEYLATILSALEGGDQSHTPQLLALLAAVMPHAHRSLLRLKFPAISAVLTRLLKEHGDEDATTAVAASGARETEGRSSSESVNVLQRLLRCMGLLLASQESSSAVWSSPSVLKGFHSLLHFFAHRRSKVRRAAHEAVAAVLTAQPGASASAGEGHNPSKKVGNSSKGPAAQTAEFCHAVVSSCTSQDVTRAMHLLQFMRLGVPLFQPKQAWDLCELSLKLLSLPSPPLTAAVMQMLSAVVQSPRPCMTAPYLSMLTEKLLELQPSRSAGAGAVSFAPLLASCVVRLQVRHVLQ